MERFELPDGWRWVKFGDVLEMSGGAQPPKSTFIYAPKKGYVRFLQIRDFGDKEVPTYIKESDAHKTCEENDILIARYGASVGKILTGKKGAYNVAMGKVIFLNDELDRRFVYYLLQSSYFQEPIRQTSRTAQAGFNGNDIKPINIPLPPLPEQHRIVKKIESLFAEARTARAALSRAEPLLKKFRQVVLSAAFRGELTERDANDEPAYILLERIRNERRAKWGNDLRAKGKDSTKAKFVEAELPNTRELGELPEGWEWATVEQIAEVRLGRQRSPSRAKGPNMRPYLRSANVTWDGLDLSDVKEMDFTPQEQKTYRLKRGDIVLVEGSGSISEVGKPAIWNDEIENCCMQNTLIRVRTDAPLPEYLHLHFQYDALGARFRHATKGIGINHLGAQGLSEWVIALPPLAEQQRIVERIETLFAQAGQIERAVEIARRRAEKVEQAVLARAFRGEL